MNKNNKTIAEPCQWFECPKQASGRVRFGLRVFDVRKDDDIFRVPYTPDTRDLCPDHIENVRSNYMHVTVSDLTSGLEKQMTTTDSP